MGFNTDLDFTVAGVLSESGPTHLNLEAISYYPLSSVPNNWRTISSMPFTTYVKLNETADETASIKKIKNLYQKNIDKDKESLVVFLEPINKIHLSSLITGDSNLKFLLAIIFLSGLLLIISCLNFINLLIAKSSVRNKEFAIKKLLGTTRTSLIKQYLSETFLQILKGREVSPAFVRDSSHSVILNQTALQMINLENPIGKTVKLDDSISYKL